MLIYVDIDETICETPSSRNYVDAIPIKENILKINELYDRGHSIYYWTARGTVTLKDWRQVTEDQFKEWGVKYHKLMFGKPAFDLLIDDKALNSLNHFDEINDYITKISVTQKSSQKLS